MAADLRGAESRTLESFISKVWRVGVGVELVLWGEFGSPDSHDAHFFAVKDLGLIVSSK